MSTPITIFTPTYNRAHLLHKLYNSLERQSLVAFEWLIVDDGSSDTTEQVVNEFIALGRLNIRYVRQANGGKHRAINTAVKLARGEYLFIVDSDDYLADNAVERIMHHISSVKHDPMNAGVCGLKVYENGHDVGGNKPFGVIDSDSIGFRETLHMKGDMAEIWNTEVLRKYPFPEFPGEKFISEAIVWNRIALDGYKLRYFYEPLYICEYRQDGLTCSIRRHYRNSPLGTMLYYNENIRRHCSAKTAIIAAINYWRYTVRYSGKRGRQFAPIFWTYLFLPIGYIFYLRDLHKESSQIKHNK
jgi:glycosyltransferase involved in cell wall biosynthesis